MNKLIIYCTSIKYYKILDKLPSYIKPLGLGKNDFPKNWLNENYGNNIIFKNKFFGEMTGIYWIWKNLIKNMKPDDKIGNCHYRKLWLNANYDVKQKLSCKSLYSNLLKIENEKLLSSNNIQVQPIIFKNKNLLTDFKEIHNSSVLETSLKFLDKENQKNFLIHLNGNKLYPLNMFITTVREFEKYCETIFPWLDQCLEYCLKNNLCQNYNIRLPAFLAERFTSYWFSKNYENTTLSYARLGKVFLSNKFNQFINPIKLPFSFRMYPTIHRY